MTDKPSYFGIKETGGAVMQVMFKLSLFGPLNLAPTSSLKSLR